MTSPERGVGEGAGGWQSLKSCLETPGLTGAYETSYGIFLTYWNYPEAS